MIHRLIALFAMTAAASSACGQPDPTAGKATVGDLPPAIVKTLEALGASSGVPDGLGASWEPSRPVSGQLASLSLFNAQAGLTLPVWTSVDEGVFATAAARGLFASGGAVFPDTRTPFPNSLWDLQAGGAYVQQVAEGNSWGVCLVGGSASDRPFHTIHEATIAGLVFWRSQTDANNAWLIYVVSTTNGQIGQNIPIPGAAYEFHSDELDGIIGLPFLSLTYRPTEVLQFDLNYTAITDVRVRASLRVAEAVRLFGGFSWESETWRLADRRDHREQLFWFEKRAEGGLVWHLQEHFDFVLTGGYAFDRYFLESRSFTLTGHNHLALAPGPFVALQLDIRY
ncbi:MAG TPA: hypothetical protein VKE40_26570 [Gemmataceae bacterium]|nr:hypothetical protein [Gemmataceae bacterium]